MLEKSSRPDDIAKGFTLLGFADESARANEVWDEFGKNQSRAKWLAEVYHFSADAYAENRECKQQFRAFWSATEIFDAYSHHSRIDSIVDDRIHLWFNAEKVDLSNENRSKWLHWGLEAKSLDSSIKRKRDRRSKNLFHTRQSFSTMSPWI